MWDESQLPPVSNQQVNSREVRMLLAAAELLLVSCRQNKTCTKLGSIFLMTFSWQHFLCAQTLQDLHSKAGIAHLDLTSSNVMLRADGVLWDTMRLIDFGFAQVCSSGQLIITVIRKSCLWGNAKLGPR
jgi:serine/threonine protein kinase